MEQINLTIPEKFNAGWFMLDCHIEEGIGDNVAIYYKDQKITYQDVFLESNRLGNALLNLGVEMENRVLCLLYDCPELIVSMLSAMRIGAVPIATNTMLPASDILYILNDSRAKVAVIHEDFVSLISSIRGQLPYLKKVIVLGQGGDGQLSYRDVLNQSSDELLIADTFKDDMAIWQYTSGTTGTPKGVVHLHHNIPYHFEAFARKIIGVTEKDIFFSAAKLFFSYGQGNSFLIPFCAGASTILLSGKAKPETIMETITRYRPTVYCGLPTSFNNILQLPDKEKYDFSSVRICLSASEVLPRPIAKRWKAAFGVEIIDGIGSTEGFYIFICNRPGEVVAGSTGKPIPGFEAKIVDDEGMELPPGMVGNLMVKGASMGAAYWNHSELSKETFLGPWVNTRDRFSRDEEGYYWFSGRKDDMIKASGVRGSPVEVENTLMTHPAVRECAVIGSADNDGLQKPKALIILNDSYHSGPQLINELQAFVKNKIAPYKFPRWIEFVDELPKTAAGKLDRLQLRLMNEPN